MGMKPARMGKATLAAYRRENKRLTVITLIIFVLLIFNYSSMMDKIDHKYNLHEEE